MARGQVQAGQTQLVCTREDSTGTPSMPSQSLLLRGTLNKGRDCQLATLGRFVLAFALHEPRLMGEWYMRKTWSHGSGVAPRLTVPLPGDGASVPVLDSQRACLSPPRSHFPAPSAQVSPSRLLCTCHRYRVHRVSPCTVVHAQWTFNHAMLWREGWREGMNRYTDTQMVKG